MYTRYVSILIIFIISACGDSSSKEKSSQPKINTAKDLIQRSVTYHDPNGNWKHFKSNILLNRNGLNNEGIIKKSITEVFLNNQKGLFKINYNNDEISLKGEVSLDTCYNRIIKVISKEVAAKYKRRLNCEGVSLDKNYYSYIIGLPMKLLDPEAIVNDTIFERKYNGTTYDVVKVNYNPIDKSPAWYFYFNKENHSFELCKFTSPKDENKGGEYIIYNKEIEVQGLKLKGQHVWLYNKPTLDTLSIYKVQFKELK